MVFVVVRTARQPNTATAAKGLTVYQNLLVMNFHVKKTQSENGEIIRVLVIVTVAEGNMPSVIILFLIQDTEY